MGTIAQVMTKQPKTVEPGTSVRSAAKHMRDAGIGSLFVKKGKDIVGIVTDTDLVRRAMATSKDLDKLTVDDIMTSPVCTIEGVRTVSDAHDMMGDLRVRHLGVTQAGEIVGVISVRDLLSYYQRNSEPKIGQD
jgi:signal-transduction protein with cAMP-binding, CBS, and nucleotidyltransferase domain